MSAVDISSEVRLSSQLSSNKKILEKILDNILDNIPAFIFLKDTNGNIIRTNESAARFCGLDPEDMKGRPKTDFFKEGEDCYLNDKKVMASKVSMSGDIQKLTTYTGQSLWVSSARTPILDKDREVQQVLVISHERNRHKRGRALYSALSETTRKSSQHREYWHLAVG